MSQAYSDPKRASDPHALPDVEVFYVHRGPRKAYDRAYQMDFCEFAESHTPHACEDCAEVGWHYWYCLPGCMPDGEPFGPFATEAEALADAQANAEE